MNLNVASIDYSSEDRIATIRINRPTALNALNTDALDLLARSWSRFSADQNSWVAILTSTGEKAFSVGMDLKEDSVSVNNTAIIERTLMASPKYHRINKPIICLIKGYCLGLGWWLAMESDIRIASTDAKLGIPEVRINMAPIFAGLVRDFLPIGVALELLLTAQPLGANRALEYGFLNKVVSSNMVEEKGVKLAKQICENGPMSIQRTKELIYQSYGMTREASLFAGSLIHEELKSMEDSIEGKVAFKEKRKALWKCK